MSNTQRTHDDYTVAWICSLEVEQVAAIVMLDEQHPRLSQPLSDSNSYVLGSVRNYNVVIAGLHATGNSTAATVVAEMKSTFPRLRFGLLVGIGGGVPTRTSAGFIRLGHVVVSKPTGQHSGTIQYDHGKAEADKFQRTGCLAPPPNILLNAAQRLAVIHARAKEDPLQEHLRRFDTSVRGQERYKHPGLDKDHLYQAGYVHIDRDLSCQKCGCDASKRIVRGIHGDEDEESDLEEDENWVTVHRGTIASGEMVIRCGQRRDELSRENDVLCFEMEAAGALNDFPCLVIRGIANYADSHKNDEWNGYAAATAAAYARELFSHLPINEVVQCKRAETDVKHLVGNGELVRHGNSADKTQKWLTSPDSLASHDQPSTLCHFGTRSWFPNS